MSSFISDSDKRSLGNVFYSIHDTFARPVSIFRTAQQIVIVPNASHNYLFEAAPFNDITEPGLVSGVFNARIRYPSTQKQEQFQVSYQGKDQQVNIQKEDGSVRIIVDVTGRNFLFDAKRVRFDNAIWSVESSDRPEGLFSPDFYGFMLTKLN
jgi:hypothetical protein